jgi:hypothetical protein
MNDTAIVHFEHDQGGDNESNCIIVGDHEAVKRVRDAIILDIDAKRRRILGRFIVSEIDTIHNIAPWRHPDPK